MSAPMKTILPREKTPPVRDPALARVLLYGASKIGKSTWASKAPGAVFLACESGLNQLEVARCDLATWEDLLQACRELAAGGHGYTTIVIDTVDEMWRLAERSILFKYKVDHPSDLSWGKGYALVAGEFHRVLLKLATLPYGLILISHAIDREVESRTGTHTKTYPTIPERPRELILALVDVILFAETVERVDPQTGARTVSRVVRSKPSLEYEAGDRTGRIPETLELDYNAFARAYATAIAGKE